MNDASSPTSPAHHHPPSPFLPSSADARRRDHPDADDEEDDHYFPRPRPPSWARRRERRRQRTSRQQRRQHQQHQRRRQHQEPSLSQRARDGLAKKLQFLNHLTHNLDALVYAELCTAYYMDCSFFRLLLRWVAQAMFISPRAEDSILVVPNYHVSAIAAPSLVCMFLHLVSAPPQAGEAARGYLHGGVLVDFVGQRAVSSRFTLLLLDLVILALQCFMMAVNLERERVCKVVRPPRRGPVIPGEAVATTPTTTATGQDYDAEERGVLRDAPTVDETDEMEMRPLRDGIDDEDDDNGDDDDHADSADGEGSGLRRRPTAATAHTAEGLLDTLRSGNAVLASFNVRRSLHIAWHNQGDTPESAAAYALQNVGYNATLAALAAQRRATLAAAQQRQL
ncbi:hypothetical protein GGR56DRAFT_670619 [Xylariaceae sp. FL0804]|nr:hypothetical protein GGR56DRAFT_670619 [Xylariaceae sp. FL0804]